MKLSFIGLGNMGSAMIGGLIKKNIVSCSDITGAELSEKRCSEVKEKYGINTTTSNKEAAGSADILILSVKPQVYETVINDIKDSVKKETVIVSIAPGKTLNWITERFGRDIKLVRCMPNTPALVMEGCTGVVRGKNVTDDEFKTVLRVLESFGKAYEVSESQIDAVVAVSGSSPAYVFMMIEAMADAAVAEGLPRKTAYEMAAQAVYGSAKMVLDTGEHPAKLKDMVCSPSGTTIDAVAVLENMGFRSSLIEAMKACADKSRRL
ncbi:MAG: pyrroline-5-carboxylate reductase [Lachnospiraceae bacterium]|nr:pyrroline-5-carboxylate reductase [Lachnospiraceae bacterium]